MDIELQRKVNEAMKELNRLAVENIDYQHLDPIARMMVVALLHETQKIEDELQQLADKITERFCDQFIPRRKLLAMPAVAVVAPMSNSTRVRSTVEVNAGASFSYKTPDSKSPLNFLPIFKGNIIPCECLVVVTPHQVCIEDERSNIYGIPTNHLWVGIKPTFDIDTLTNFSFMVKGLNGILPERIRLVAGQTRELNYATIDHMEDIEMLEPFDSQQSSETFFSILQHWKEQLTEMTDLDLYYISENQLNRDAFKTRNHPQELQEGIEHHTLEHIPHDTIWLEMEFADDVVVPDGCTALINAIPVVNVDVNQVSLTQTTPIAKLQKGEDSFFLQLLETSNYAHRQGFNMQEDEVIVRDFDAVCYHDGHLFREVRNLYNRFIEDYYAFIDYNAIKDGETIKTLRQLINRIGKSVGTINQKDKYDSGVYVMKNINQQQNTTSTSVAFLTTQGEQGNLPQEHQFMENKKVAALGKEVEIVVTALGGCDKASHDQRYELLNYYALTNDRLYTRMDIEAFLRKELIGVYGQEEFRRIDIHTSIEGAMGQRGLQRGLYVDIKFKDYFNYEKATRLQLGHILQCRIRNKSCIGMPIHVSLKNLDER
ncbi:MAG: hypothetical protein KBT12_03010 [Bacteroidales bacterium]|nr:hypothetical protein [Candidatus Physcousia equi]